MRHILVTGLGKTGTTGVYASVKSGLKAAGIPARTVFEPRRSRPVDSLFRYAPEVSVLTKVLMDSLYRVIPDIRVFDRRVMTVRDPRDRVVSLLVFRPLVAATIKQVDESAVRRFVEALEAKQADPSSRSVRELFELAARLGIGEPPFEPMLRLLKRQRALVADGVVHPLSYERFVRGDLEDLSGYLGFPVEYVSAREATWFGHVARSASSGDFTRWFRPDDLAYFNEMFSPTLRAFGYPLDVELEHEPTIDPATSSEYVWEQYRRRRERLAEARREDWSPLVVDSVEALGRLVEAAEDGSTTACLRVAKVHLSGHLVLDHPGLDRPGGLGDADRQAALSWATRAAELGSVSGMRLTVRLLEELDPADPALRRALRGWRLVLAEKEQKHRAGRKTKISRSVSLKPRKTGRPRLFWASRAEKKVLAKTVKTGNAVR